MKTILKITVLTISLVLMLIADLPFLPVQLVPEAEAIFGVRRRAWRRGVRQHRSAAWSITTAVATSIVRCSRGTAWCT